MNTCRRYGDAVAHSIGLDDAPSIQTRSLKSSQIALSRLSCGNDRLGRTSIIPAEDTFILALYLTEMRRHELWSHGKPAFAQGYAANAMRIVNLREEYSAHLCEPHESLCFYMPRHALNEFADDAGARRMTELSCPPGIVDPIMTHLGAALLPAFERPEQAKALYIDHAVMSVCAHVTTRYGGLDPGHLMPRGGLSPLLEDRAKDYLVSNTAVNVSVADVARVCGISRGHFIRAFKLSTGFTPHRWLQRYRIDKAKELMLKTDESIAQIALLCGFADQSHLTRVFSALVGASPALWRRSKGSG